MSKKPRSGILGMPSFQGAKPAMGQATSQPQQQLAQLVQLYQAGRFGDAIKLGGKLSKAMPGAVQVWNVLGASYAQTGQFSNAVAAFQRSVKLRPDHPDPHNNLGNALKGLGRLDEARRAYAQALKIAPQNPLALNNLGVSEFEQGKLDEARALLQRALAAAPNYAEAHNNLGNVFLALGDVDRAQDAYRTAVKANPRFAEAHYNLGVVAQQQGAAGQAESHYLQALQLQPNHVGALRNLGVLLKDQEQLDKARMATERALQFAPDHVETLVNLGLIEMDQSNWKKALDAFDRAIAADSTHLPAILGKADALQEMHQLGAAIALLQDACASMPDAFEPRANLGLALQRQGKPEEALALYDDSLAQHPDTASLYLNRGLALSELGRSDEAAESIWTAFKTDPANSVAARNLARLVTGRLPDGAINALSEFMESSGAKITPPSSRSFFAADVARHKGDLDAAFAHIVEGNAQKKATVAGDIRKDERDLRVAADKLANWYAPAPRPRASAITPVFLWGPSRSGKSVLEGMLAQNSFVAPEYEAIRKVPQKSGAFDIDEVFYTDSKALEAQSKRLLTSTNPFSLLDIAALAEGFLDAVFVFVRRDPIDTGAEMFAHLYGHGNDYSYDAAATMGYIGAYNELVDLLVGKLGDRAILVHFADILKDTAGIVRQILDCTTAELPSVESCDLPKTIALHSIYRDQFQRLVATPESDA